MPAGRMEKTEVRRMDSGDLLDQPEASLETHPTFLFLMRHIRIVQYHFVVLKEGYAPLAISHRDLVLEAGHRTPEVADLPPLPQTCDDAALLLREALPALAPNDPLRGRVEAILNLKR